MATAAEHFEQIAVENSARVLQAALERGGLPAEDEIAKTYDTLCAAHDAVEDIAFRVESIAVQDASRVPTVTLEDIGTASVIATDVRRLLADIADDVSRIERHLFSLEAIRQEQKKGREPFSWRVRKSDHGASDG